MTKRAQQLISSLLALAFAFAGMVAVSPALHLIIEHGGRGPAHTHSGVVWETQPGEEPTTHLHPHLHERTVEAESEEAPPGRGNLFVTAHRSFAIPTIPVRQWLAFFAHLGGTQDAPVGSGSGPGPSGPSHDHQSLAHSLACGCVEGSVGMFFLTFSPAAFELLLPSPSEVRLERWLDTQTAGRAPPVCLS